MRPGIKQTTPVIYPVLAQIRHLGLLQARGLGRAFTPGLKSSTSNYYLLQPLTPARWASDPPSPWWGRGGGSFEPPSNSAPGRDSGKTRTMLDNPSKSVRNHISHFLAQVDIEVTTGQWMKSFRCMFLALVPDLIKLDPRSWHHSIPLIMANRMMYNVTILGQFPKKMTWPKARSRSAFQLTWSICI